MLVEEEDQMARLFNVIPSFKNPRYKRVNSQIKTNKPLWVREELEVQNKKERIQT